LNDSEAAIKAYQQALDRKPDFVEAHLRLAEVFLEKSNPPEALPHLEWLMAHSPDRPEVQARLGRCRFLQGQLEEARRLFESAVEKLPKDIPLLVDLAQLDLQENRPGEAEQLLRRVLQADPLDVEAEFALVTSLKAQGRLEEAAAVLEAHENHKPQLQRASQLLKDEAEHPSNNANNAAEIGTVFLLIGQERLGLFWLDQALARDPGHPPAHKALADYYEKKGEPDKAAAHRRWLREPDRKAG
jgi:tetratricopeptide (TPR) repeat protein